MNEADLKQFYVKLFQDELIKEWEEVTSQADFRNVTDEEIVAVIQEKLYKHSNA